MNYVVFICFANLWLVFQVLYGQAPDTLWTRTYGGNGTEYGSSVQETTDGGYIIVGTISLSPNQGDVWLIKTDSNGDTIWTKTYGGNNNEYGESVQQTSDGGYIITGNTSSFGSGSNDLYLIRTDSFGDTLWTKTIGGIAPDYGTSVRQTTNGGFIITGSTESFGVGN